MNFESQKNSEKEALDQLMSYSKFFDCLEEKRRVDFHYEEDEFEIVDVNYIRYVAANQFILGNLKASGLVLYADLMPHVIDSLKELRGQLNDEDMREHCEELIRRGQLYMASRDQESAAILENVKIVEFDGHLSREEKDKLLQDNGFRSLKPEELHRIEAVLAADNINVDNIYYQQATGALREKRGG